MKIRFIGVIRVRFRGSTGSLLLRAQEIRMRLPGALEFLARTSAKNEPMMNVDERRFVATGLGCGAGSLAAGMRGAKHSEKGLEFDEGRAQEKGIEDIVHFSEFRERINVFIWSFS